MSNTIVAHVERYAGRSPQSIADETDKLAALHLGVSAVNHIDWVQMGTEMSMEMQLPPGISEATSLEFFAAMQKVAGLRGFQNFPTPVHIKDTANIEEASAWGFPTQVGKESNAEVAIEILVAKQSRLGWTGNPFIERNSWMYWTGLYGNVVYPAGDYPGDAPFTHNATPIYRDVVEAPTQGSLSKHFAAGLPFTGPAARGGMMIFSYVITQANVTEPLVIPAQGCKITADGKAYIIKPALSVQGDTDLGLAIDNTMPNAAQHLVNDGTDSYAQNYERFYCAVKQGDDGAGVGGADLVSLYPYWSLPPAPGVMPYSNYLLKSLSGPSV